ncbi:DNA polymerase V subunit UmuC [Salmonella enterica subsp. arizonae]|uniref:DNA polymerase V subunit UmuC n=1 Tax=Salmonella enterica subsp. arizonae TaxID=59203 RepID=A0A379TBX1_SALER|nr:DNA polymerase V subunit UmuC [Salmonella enterica subsp. arizonae]
MATATRKRGVMLGDFFSQGVAQLNLFDDNAPRAGSEKLMEVLDHLNAKDGKGDAILRRAGDSATVGYEARNAFAAVHHKVL